MAMEFVILIGMGFLIAMLVVVLIYDMNKERSLERTDSKMRDFAYTVQSEIILASEMNDGYQRNITLNEEIEKTDYSIYIMEISNFTQLSIGYDDKTINYRIPNVEGIIDKGNNLLRNINGTVNITQ